MNLLQPWSAKVGEVGTALSLFARFALEITSRSAAVRFAVEYGLV